MNSKRGFLRHIGLIIAVLLLVAPLIPAYAADVPREKTLIIGFEGGPAQAPENFGLNATALNSQGVHQVMIESLYILNYQTGKAEPWLEVYKKPNESWNLYELAEELVDLEIATPSRFGARAIYRRSGSSWQTWPARSQRKASPKPSKPVCSKSRYTSTISA